MTYTTNDLDNIVTVIHWIDQEKAKIRCLSRRWNELDALEARLHFRASSIAYALNASRAKEAR